VRDSGTQAIWRTMQVTSAEKRVEFVSQAQSARREAMQTGKGYPAADVHAYLRLRA